MADPDFDKEILAAAIALVESTAVQCLVDSGAFDGPALRLLSAVKARTDFLDPPWPEPAQMWGWQGRDGVVQVADEKTTREQVASDPVNRRLLVLTPLLDAT